MMDFLQNIDWNNDDGVFVPMLNDVVRNRFYESIIKENVQGKSCVDIGFGTGMLSLLALKHGAAKVTAYESNHNRYLLGQEILSQLKLKEKISLINEKFDHKTVIGSDQVLISETVSTNLWSEGMYFVMPRCQGVNFLPGEYFLDLVVLPVPYNYVDILNLKLPMHSFFAPGIELGENFELLINKFLNKNITVENNTHSGLVKYNYRFDDCTVWGWSPFLKLAQQCSASAGYTLNTKTQTIDYFDNTGRHTVDIDFDKQYFELVVDLPNEPAMILPRVGIRHQEKTLYLDQAESWGALSPVFSYTNNSRLTVTHNFHHGAINYLLED